MAGRGTSQDDVQGSPHFFLADGSDVHDPGIALHRDEQDGYPVVDSDDPGASEDLARRAAGATADPTDDGGVPGVTTG
ncbi:hypothetical protein [Modestobacter sp. I12A-02662]|uniref:hypothetical protein n=1 Tax=Modestobacter sp. I12A-02662 TaxID=1730496 RepID=UPI0034DF4DDC